MSKSYTPEQLQFAINKLQAKSKRAVTNFLIASVSTEDLSAYLWRVQDFNTLAASEWLTRIELENIYYKTENDSFYDVKKLSSRILDLFEKYPVHPFSQWIATQPGYREAYLNASQNGATSVTEVACYEAVRGTVADMNVSADSHAHPPQLTPSNDHLPATHGKLYPNVVRLANEIGMYAEAQLWHITKRLTDGSGKVDTQTVRGFYTENHCGNDATFYRVLNAGNGVWWTLDKTNGFIWYTGLEAVGTILGKLLPVDRIQHYRGNNAVGGKPVFARLTGSKQTFMQTAFATWIEQRKKGDSVTIANATLATLWKVDKRTIQRWKKLCDKQDNFAVQAPYSKHQAHPDVPAHAVNTPKGEKLYQISSSYTPPDGVRKHSKRGKSRKARKAFYRAIQAQSADNRLGGIWDAEERLSSEKRYWIHDDIDTAFLLVDKILRKPTSDVFLPRHVRLAHGKRVAVWETVTDTRQRVESVYVA